MFLRRTGVALATSAVLCAVTAPVAVADESPSPKSPADKELPTGLYGTGDPQYDGVWRQSVALLAQDAAGVTPSRTAMDWLVVQQCQDGSFAAYRADAGELCTKKTVADVNATAAAVQALAARGGNDEHVHKAVGWLEKVQNEDGGWGYNPGAPSDANSVSVVIGALVAADRDPAKVTAGGESAEDGASPYDALLGFHLGCDAKKAERGAFAYQPDKKGKLAANDDATAAATLAALGRGMAVESVKEDGDADGTGNDASTGAPGPLKCGSGDGGSQGRGPQSPEEAGEAGAAYLTAVLKENGGHLLSAIPGAEEQPDYGNTADAVIALAAGGHKEAARYSLRWLEKNASKWEKSADDPAALGLLVLAAHAVDADPSSFGGIDLVERLNATGPGPQRAGAADSPTGESKEESGTSTTMWWSLFGAGLVGFLGLGLLLVRLRAARRS